MTRVLVVDTSYLLELLAVPGCSNGRCSQAVRDLFKTAFKDGDRIFVPLPCIFEVGNHIVDVRDGGARRRIAEVFVKTVTSSVKDNNPWIITPAQSLELLPAICQDFLSNHAHDGVGLSDCCIVHEADRLKRKYHDKDNYCVHIWTKDTRLKAREPDTEENAFLG